MLDKFSRKKQLIIKLVILALFLVSVGVCFGLSLTPGNESAEQSTSVGNALAGEYGVKTETDKASQIYINDLEDDVYEGDTVQITVSVYPQTANDGFYIEVSDTEIAAVDAEKQEITFLKDGAVTITTYSKFNVKVKATKNLTVLPSKKGVTAISIDMNDEYLINDNIALKCIANDGEELTNCNWIIECDSNVAEMPWQGSLLAKTQGNVVVTATFESFTATKTITILPQKRYEISELEITCESKFLTPGQKMELSITPVFKSGEIYLANIPFIYLSSNSSVLHYNKGFEFVARSPGNVSLSVRWWFDSNVCATINFTVAETLSPALDISGKNALKQGDSTTFSALMPQELVGSSLTWFSQNEGCVTIDETGVATARKTGKAIIGVSGVDQNGETITAYKQLTVTVSSKFYYLVRKLLGHFAMFGGIGMLGTLTCLCFIKRKPIAIAVDLVCGFAIAGFSEMFQLPIFTSGRFCTWSDIGIDFSGYVLGIIFTILALKIILVIIRKKQKKSPKIEVSA